MVNESIPEIGSNSSNYLIPVDFVEKPKENLLCTINLPVTAVT